MRLDRTGRGPAIDLANTLVARGSDAWIDLLETSADLEEWLRREHAWIGEPGEGTALRLADFRELRNAIRDLFLSATRGHPLPAGATRRVNAVSAASTRWPELDVRDPDGPRAVQAGAAGSRTAAIMATIARSAIELLGGPDRARLRVCGAPRCGSFHLSSRRGQVWCTPSCGNRARVARHQARAGGA